MQIRGKVIDDPIPLDGCSAYAVKWKNSIYLVFTSGEQSAKDCILVNKNQEIEISGRCISEIEGVVLPDKAQIRLYSGSTEW